MDNVDFLYKYTTFEAALAIFGSLHLKWSSPILFNDPFDSKGGVYSFTSKEFADCFDKKLKNEMFSDKETRISKDRIDLYEQVEIFRQKPSEKKEDLYKKINVHKIANDTFYKNIERLLILREDDRRDVRVLCLSKEDKEPLMWSHYAKSHSGVLLKFKRIMVSNSIVSEAEEISYSEKYPVFSFTPEEVADEVFCAKNSDCLTEFYEHLLTKSIIWKYEKEWRCISRNSADNNDLFEFREFNPLEIDSVVLGCQMGKENEKLIRATLQNQLKHVKLFKAVQGERSYGLKYVKI